MTAMTVRIHDQQDGRNVGRADAGDGNGVPCFVLAFGLLYMAVHGFVWLGTVILP